VATYLSGHKKQLVSMTETRAFFGLSGGAPGISLMRMLTGLFIYLTKEVGIFIEKIPEILIVKKLL